MEAEKTYLDSAKAKTLKDTGTGMDPQRLAAQSYGPAWEIWALAQPTYTYHRKPLQNPGTGAFYFMAGVDPLGSAPLGGG